MQERVPRSTGEIFSDALALLRRHFRLFYVLALPFCTVDLILRESGASTLQIMRGMLKPDASFDTSSLLEAGGTFAGGMALLLASGIVLQLLGAACIGMVRSAWQGKQPAVSDGLGSLARRGFAVIVTSIVAGLGLVLLMALPSALIIGAAIVSPILAAVVVVLSLIFVVLAVIVMTLRWGLLEQTAVLEERIGTGALFRSTALMAARGLPFFQGPKFSLSILFLINFAIAGMLQSGFAVPRIVVALGSGWNIVDGMPPLASMPLWFIIPFGLLEVASNALIMPFGSILLTLFYYDLRVRYEAIDLDAPATTA